MRTLLFSLCLFCTFISCKKEVEGLSPETGNLEIYAKDAPIGIPYYAVYTEEQYYLFLSNRGGVPIMDGPAEKHKATLLKGLQKGYYGIHIYGEGKRYHKPISIVPNQVNKVSFP